MSQPPAWNVKQLWEEMFNRLSECKTSEERANVANSCKANIIAKAEEWKRERKLTPMEEAILEQCG